MQDILFITISMFGPVLIGYGIRRIYFKQSNFWVFWPRPAKITKVPVTTTHENFDVTQKDFGGKKDNPYEEN